MNPETVNLIERPYREVVDDILTALVGGVINEPIIYDVKTDLYPLAEPAKGVQGITGTLTSEVNGKPQTLRHEFQKEIDFAFDSERNAVVWQEGGNSPDDESIFYVDYFRPDEDSRSPLTDINVGSVTRILSEAIGRECATVYEQINRAYLFGFIDTAEGKALDLAVAILGVTRKTKDFAVGLATFFRDPTVTGNITITQNALLSTEKGDVIFRTTQPRALQQGQVRIDVPIRADDAFKGDVGKVDAGAITKPAQPIAGIARVTNFDAAFLGDKDESDEELRLRAKAVLRALGKATLAALARVIFEGRAKLLETWDSNSLPVKRSPAGTAVLMVESEPERLPSLRARVEETRAAGVQVTLVARYVFFKPRMIVDITTGLTAAGKEKVKKEIINALQARVDELNSGDPADGQNLLKAIKYVSNVTEAKIVDVMVWRADIEKPGAESLVDALTTAVATVPTGDTAALRTTLGNVLSQKAPTAPTERRIPDRSLVQGPDGQRATDEQVEAGDFQVSATVSGEPWSVVLDMDPADIRLQEKGG